MQSQFSEILGVLRSIDLNFDRLDGFEHKISKQCYEKMLICLLEVRFVIDLFLKEVFWLCMHQTQEFDSKGYQRRTKFLAKTYLDIFLVKLSNFEQSKTELYLLTCFRTAIKFNQNRRLSEALSLTSCSNVVEGRFQHQDFIEAELQLLKILNFRLNWATPYDFLDIYEKKWNEFSVQACCKDHLEKFIDFAISLSSSFMQSSESIFIGSFLISYNPVAGKRFKDFMRSHVPKWSQGTRMKVQIAKEFRQLEG